MSKNKVMKTSYLMRRFIPYYKKYRWILLLDLFCYLTILVLSTFNINRGKAIILL